MKLGIFNILNVRIRVSLRGGGWIRTTVGVCQQIYSLPPLAARARHLMPLDRSISAGQKAQSWRQDLNPQPVDYKSTALPVELRQQ
jgi:hypothetical protein